ncbi:MAG: CDP-diacylglycerol--glycerol-3-phosphate 3-phosphatidyltransferase [Acidobacteriota bacterium]
MRDSPVWNLPNSITVFRIFLVPLLVVVLLTKELFGSDQDLLGLGIFLVAAASDWLDGWLARRRGQVTTLGTLLDPIADKLLTSAAFISLVEMTLAPAWMVVIIIGREFAVSGLRAVASSHGVTIGASFWGKGKTGSQILAISLLIVTGRLGEFRRLGEFALWLVMALALLSAVDYFYRFLADVLSEPDPSRPDVDE